MARRAPAEGATPSRSTRSSSIFAAARSPSRYARRKLGPRLLDRREGPGGRDAGRRPCPAWTRACVRSIALAGGPLRRRVHAKPPQDPVEGGTAPGLPKPRCGSVDDPVPTAALLHEEGVVADLEAVQVLGMRPSRRVQLTCVDRAVFPGPGRPLPGAAPIEPQPLHVPAQPRRVRRGGLQPRGARQGRRGSRHDPPDRRHAPARANPGRGRRPRSRAAGRREGAGRAPDAGRPGPQRPGPRLPRWVGGRRGLHERAPLQPRHAPGVDRGR